MNQSDPEKKRNNVIKQIDESSGSSKFLSFI